MNKPTHPLISLFSTLLLAAAICPQAVWAQARGGEADVSSSELPAGKVYALIVGISDYKSELIPDLKYAAGDARAVADYLLSAPLQIGQIVEFYDKDATFANINEKGLNYIDELVIRKEIKPEDIIILYFAGHGGAFNDLNSYFFPYDALHMTDGESSLRIKRIKNKLQDWVEERNLKAFFILDACRSATIGMKEEGLVLVSKYLEEKTGEILMAATSGGQPAMEYGDLNHGVFTYYFLEGVYGKADANKNGLITASELGRYINNNVAQRTDDKQVPYFDYAKYQTTNLFKVDQNLMAKADAQLKLDLNSATATMVAMRGGKTEKATYSPEVTKLIIGFDDAVQNKKMVRPDNACASYYFNELQKQLQDEKTKLKFKNDFSVALFDAAKQTLENDLNGLRNYMQQSMVQNAGKSSDESKMYDLHYYADAVKALELFIKISVNGKEDKMEVLLNYLRGRDNYIRYSDAATYEKGLVFLKEAEKNFLAGLKIAPREPYLLMGYAFVQLDLTKEKEAIQLAQQASRLAPLWSWPLNFIGSVYYNAKNDSSHYYLDKAISINPRDFMPYDNLGNVYYESGDYDKAIVNYQKAIAQYSHYKYTRYNLGYAFYYMHKSEDAVIQFKKSLEIDPDYYLAYNGIGFILKEQGRKEEALEQYRKSIEVNPSYLAGYHNLGYLLGDLGRREEAMVQYRRIIEIDPNYVDAYINLGYELFKLERTEESVKAYQAAVAVDPKNASAYHGIAAGFNALGKKDEAILEYKNALSVDSTYVAAYLGLGNLICEKGDKEGGIKMYRKGIEVDPKYVDAYFDLAYELNETGKKEEAVTTYLKAIAIDPKYVSAYKNLGKVYADLGKSDEAIQCYMKVIELEPKSAWGYHSVAFAYSAKGKKEDALKFYQKAIETEPTYVEAYLGASNVNSELGNKEEAIRFSKKATEVNPKYTDAFFNLGYYLNEAGRKEEAIDAYSKAIELNPSSLSAYKNVAQIYKDLGRLDEAIASYRKALELSPKEAASYNNLGSALNDAGKNGEAMTMFERSVALDPTNTYSRHMFAYILNALGLKGESCEQYRKILEIDPEYPDGHYNLATELENNDKHEEAIKEYQVDIQRNPTHTIGYTGIGYAYMKLKQNDDAYKAFSKAISLDIKNPTNYYNLACFHAANNDFVKARAQLRLAFVQGYDNHSWMMSDTDLAQLRETPEFKSMVDQYFKDGKRR